MSTRNRRSSLLPSTFHVSCLAEDGTTCMSTEEKKPITIDTTVDETDDYDPPSSPTERERNHLAIPDDDDHSTADMYPTPAVRYGRNSGMRRLEDLKRRLQEDGFQHHSSTTLLEEEIRWEVRLPPSFAHHHHHHHGQRRGSSGSRVEDKVSSSLLPTVPSDHFRDSKWFHFGNRWWVMHFGIGTVPSVTGTHPSNGEKDEPPCYFLYVCPAERLTEPAYVAMECLLFPPPSSSSLSPLGSSGSSSTAAPRAVYRQETPGDVCFGCVDSGEEGGQYVVGPAAAAGAMQGWDRFIPVDQLPHYVSEDGKIQLTLIMRSRLGPHGQLLGCQ